MKQRILIATRHQFGYHVTTYEYAKHLRDAFDPTVICWDYGRTKFSLAGVRTIYISRSGNIITRNVRFRYHVLRALRDDYQRAFLLYFVGVSLAHLVARQSRLVCYVDTARVGTTWLQRFMADLLTYLELLTFRHRMMISKCLGEKFRLRKYEVLPLGGVRVGFDRKELNEFKLLYVGTLDRRRVHETVIGLGKFQRAHGQDITCTYDIAGSGPDDDVQRIRDAIAEYDLEDVVTLHGFVPHEALHGLLRRCNVGISYVPMYSFFDCQPPTKTYEYLLAGLVVLSTGTQENRRITTEERGIVIQDSPDAVAEGLQLIWQHRTSYHPEAIQEGMKEYEWSAIVRDILVPYFRAMDS